MAWQDVLPLVLRSVKGEPLDAADMDLNFTLIGSMLCDIAAGHDHDGINSKGLPSTIITDLGGPSGWQISENTLTGGVNSLIVGGKIQSPDWGADAGSQFDLINKTLKIGGSSAPKFSVNASGVMTALDAHFSGAITASTIDIGGTDATSVHVDANGNIWSGAATFASASFRVSYLGALVATNAMITGTITGSTFQTAASGARIIINVAGGIQAWNADSVQTVDINVDGSGWIGLTGTRALQWTAAGVVKMGGFTANATTLSDTAAGKTVLMSVGATAFAAGTTGAPEFYVTSAGALVATNATIGGAIVGATIDIGGADATSFHVDASGNFWSGAAAYADAPFKVSAAGAMTALSATISGAITATGGTIGGFTIDVTDGLYAGSAGSRVQMKAGVGIWLGATAFADAPFSVSNAGALKSLSGTIGGFTLSSTSLYAGSGTTRIQLNTAAGIHLGATAFADAPFSVSRAGSLIATNATISGTITATAGTIGGFTVNATDGLYAGSGATRVQMKPGAGIWSGATAIGDAPFSVTNAGVLKSVSGTIGGFTLSTTQLYAGSAATRIQLDTGAGIHLGATEQASAPFSVTLAGVLRAVSGTIGGWTLGETSLSASGVTFDSATPAIKMGDATDYRAGAGLFAGLSGGLWKMHFGDPDGNFISYDGAGRLYSPELWITNLVSQQVVATIGGRIIVAPSTTLAAAIDADDVTITTRHNNLAVNDTIYMEAGGRVEFMTVTAGPTGTGPYTYTVTRDLDGTGANIWNEGDSIVNTGIAGDGFLDIYSDRGTKGGTYLLQDNCSSLDGWTDSSTGDAAVTVDPAGQFCFDTNNSAADDRYAYVYRAIISPPDKFTAILRTYFDAIGTHSGGDYFQFYYSTSSWRLTVRFGTDGLRIVKVGNVTTLIPGVVLSGALAAWQTWRFQVDKTAGEAEATVEVFLDDVSLGTYDCDYLTGSSNGRFLMIQYGYGTDNRITHIDQVNVLSGHGEWTGAQYGPTIVGNVRNSAAFNDWTEAWAIGNLNGLYGYNTDIYGAAFGKYSDANYLTIDPTNGLRFFDADDVLRAQLSSSTWTLGSTADNHISISAGHIYLKNGATVYTDLAAGALTLGNQAGGEYVTVASTGIQMFGNAAQRVNIASDGTGWLGTDAGITWDALGNITVSGTITAASLPSLPSDATLVAYWSFDDGAGTGAIDNTGHGNAGTLVNSPTWTAAGISGGCLSFNSSSDQRVTIPENLIPNIAAGCSVSLWIWLAESPSHANPRYFSICDGTNDFTVNIYGQDGASPKVQISATPTAAYRVRTTSSLTFSTWYHIAGVFSGTSMKIYINGVEAATSAQAVSASTYSAIGGGYTTTTYHAHGKVDEVRLYSSILTAAEVKALYLNPRGQAPTTISGYGIKTGILTSANWSVDAGSEIDLNLGTIKLGGSSAPAFSVTSAGVLTATGAIISGAISASTIDIGGADATSFHVDVDGNIWSGAAAFANGVFKVSSAGALTATGATVQSAASGARILLNSTGLAVYDASAQRAAILATGAGWFGSSTTLAWTTAGVVTAAGWTIGTAAIYKDGAADANSSGMAPADYPFYAGKKYADRATAPFRVTPAGAMTSTSGSIGGFHVDANSLHDAADTCGISSYADGIECVRFWAGDTYANRATAPLRITDTGKIYIKTQAETYEGRLGPTSTDSVQLWVYSTSTHLDGRMIIGPEEIVHYVGHDDGTQANDDWAYSTLTKDEFTINKVLAAADTEVFKASLTTGNLSITGNFVVATSGKGIDFSAAHSDKSHTSNLLACYEEGTWTPALTFGGGNTGITYETQVGKYTKIGNQVTVTFIIVLTSNGSSTGAAVITGLPFTCATGVFATGVLLVDWLARAMGITQSTASLYTASDTAALTEAAFSDSAIVFGSITYLT